MYLLVIQLFFSIKIKAQTEDEQLNIIEKHIENSEFSADFNELYEFLNTSKTQKININAATPFQLYSLGFLNYNQIKAIINHRKEFGDFLSPIELQTIDSLPIETLNKLILFIEFSSKPEKINLKSAFLKSDKKISILSKYSIPQSIAYYDSTLSDKYRFIGSPLLSRMRFSANFENKLQIGINGEKDPGEEFLQGINKKGYDFYSGYLLIKNRRIIKTAILGDYKADFGQGLVLSGGFNTGKNALITNIKKNNTGLRHYSSFNENDFFRGVATTLNLKKTELTVLVSGKKKDANFDTVISQTNKNIYIDYLDESGYHRTNDEIFNKKNVFEFVVAQNLNYTKKNYRFGITSLFRHNNFESQKSEMLYNKYFFNSKTFFKTGLNWDYYFKNINFFGEGATASNRSYGMLCGTNISLGSIADFTSVYRYYSKSFIWNYSNAFSEKSNSVNETGFYTGIIIFPKKKLKLSAFADFYKFLYYEYYTDGVARGDDFFAEVKYEINKENMIYFRYRTKSKLRNIEEFNYNSLDYDNKTSFRVHAEKSFSKVINANFRFELSEYKTVAGSMFRGDLLYVDFTFKNQKFPLSINSRYTVFNVDDYSSRIYVVENDLLYTWSVPAFYDSGSKFYILLKLNYQKLILQYKFSIIKYYNKSAIGSGNTLIKSDKIQENGLLIQFSFN